MWMGDDYCDDTSNIEGTYVNFNYSEKSQKIFHLVLTFLRLSEISMKNWSAKMKAVLTPQL